MHSCGAGHLAIVPLAALAALGWWVLRVNEKDAAGAIKWAGRVVGWVLVAIGLSGAACAGMSHIKGRVSGGHGAPSGTMLPPGHPPVPGALPPSLKQ